MGRYSECSRAFVHRDYAWGNPLDQTGRRTCCEVKFGLYWEDGSPANEMVVRWVQGDGKLLPLFECPIGAWAMLSEMPDLASALSALGDQGTPLQFCATLRQLGFRERAQSPDAAGDGIYDASEVIPAVYRLLAKLDVVAPSSWLATERGRLRRALAGFNEWE